MSEFILQPLPFEPADFKALSVESFEYHYGKHHKAYVDNLNKLLLDNEAYKTISATQDLVGIMKKSYANMCGKNERISVEVNLCAQIEDFNCPFLSQLTLDEKIFNNAAQHWNHAFFWNSITPIKKDISSKMANLIEDSFGSVEKFAQMFYESGIALFGSGWVWLVFNKMNENLEIVQTSNAGTLGVLDNYIPLLVCDVWEHAYYIDYRNKRVDFLKVVIEHFNWEFAQKNLEQLL